MRQMVSDESNDKCFIRLRFKIDVLNIFLKHRVRIYKSAKNFT